MGQRIIRSLDEFALTLRRFGEANAAEQRRAVNKSEERTRSAMRSASIRLGGGDRKISGVGKSGGFLAFTITRQNDGREALGFTVKPGGPWSIRDNSVSGGDTAVRIVSPNLKRTPRTIPPRKMIKPSLKTKNGIFISNNVRGTTGPFVQHNAGAGRRIPAWKNAVRSLQPVIIEESAEAMRKAAIKAFD